MEYNKISKQANIETIKNPGKTYEGSSTLRTTRTNNIVDNIICIDAKIMFNNIKVSCESPVI